LKLLFDQNISPRIVKLVDEKFSGSSQVRHVGLEDASDHMIFEYARKNNFTIVTFDADFIDINTLRGTPPKIIWLNTGNLTTKSIAQLLKTKLSTILDFVNSKNTAILEIDNSPI